jgi:hypothetical protein
MVVNQNHRRVFGLVIAGKVKHLRFHYDSLIVIATQFNENVT